MAALVEADRLAWHIFDLEHQLGIGGHNDGYNCMKCWASEDAGISELPPRKEARWTKRTG